MSKARELSNLTSDGSPLADGAINASEVSGLSTVATSGSYNDLINVPAPFDPATLATVATTGAYSDLSGKPALASVATTGAYSSLSGLPTIPTLTSQLTNNSGFLTSAPAPTTAQVGTATAGLAAGAVGSYVCAFYVATNAGAGYSFGQTTPGSNLRTTDLKEQENGGALSGTWRVMAKTGSANRGAVWLRIS